MKRENSLSDDQLIVYLDGEAEVNIKTAIEADLPLYAERLAQLEAEQTFLLEQLAGARIDAVTLGEYQMGLLPRAEARRIRAYLKTHPHAARELQQFDEFAQALEPTKQTPPSLWEHAKFLVARLVDGGGMQPALAGVRGEQEGIYEAGEYQIVIESDTDFDRPTHQMVSGLLMGADETDGMIAHLWHNDQALAEADLDEFGNFTFTQLQSGQYELIITDGTTAIHIEQLRV